MEKTRVSTIAAGIVLAAMVIVTGCGQPNKTDKGAVTPPTTKDNGKDTKDTAVGQVKAEDIAGDSVEFSKVLPVGSVKVTIAANTASVWFKETSGTVYAGNGTVSKDGVMAFDLANVEKASEKIPFKAKYTRKTGVCVITALKESFPHAPQPLTKKEQGNKKVTERTFIRKVGGLVNGLDDKNGTDYKQDVSATFFIVLDADKVVVTAFYGNETIGMSTVTKTASLEGNAVWMDLTIAKVPYRLKLTFTLEEKSGEEGEEGTQWYLGERNESGEYTGGFQLHLVDEQIGKDKADVLADNLTFHKKVALYTKAAPSAKDKIGDLTIDIRGSLVTLRMRTQVKGTAVEETKSVEQVKRVQLKRQLDRKDAWESTPLATAQTANGGRVDPTDSTVFAFLYEQKADVTEHIYNTFDFQITDYDPVSGKLGLKAQWLEKKTVGNKAGSKLIGADPAAIQDVKSLYLKESDLNSKALDGLLF